MSPSDDPLTRRFIEDAGNATQALGVGRVVGQIYAYLYFSEPARTLDDMKEALGISKGCASMGVRQLEQWGAVQRVWVKGDRKDYYAANDYFGRIVRNILVDVMGKQLAALGHALDKADEELNGSKRSATEQPSDTDGRSRNSGLPGTSPVQEPDNVVFLRSRMERLRDFQTKVSEAWNNPLVRMLLK
jgi:DNA-binding transcriptional regulator GbsR (MarR family)